MVVVVEHEGVDHDVLARAALDFEQRLLKGLGQRWIKEDGVLAFHVRRRFAVGDDDDLLVAGLVPVEELAGQHQAVLDVGPVDRLVVGQFRQLVRLDRPRVVTEGDHLQEVAGKLAADQRIERQRDLLGGVEVAAQWHRPAHVDHQHGCRLGAELRPVHLEVVGLQPDRLP